MARAPTPIFRNCAAVVPREARSFSPDQMPDGLRNDSAEMAITGSVKIHKAAADGRNPIARLQLKNPLLAFDLRLGVLVLSLGACICL